MENVINWYDAVPYTDIKNIIRDRVTAMAREIHRDRLLPQESQG